MLQKTIEELDVEGAPSGRISHVEARPAVPIGLDLSASDLYKE